MKKPENQREPANTAPEQVNAQEAEQLLAEADDAVIDMEARERRRDTTYRTGGDDLDPEIDDVLDGNAPKEQELSHNRPAGNRGASNWH